MKFEPKTIILKDGRSCTLRPTHPDDAAEMIAYMKQIAEETRFTLRTPEEVTYTLEQEREILGHLLEDNGSVMMLAEVDGQVAGNCSISGMGYKSRVLHRCSLAIALKKDFWNLGIGFAMITYLTELARQIGFEQIELDVVSDNERGIKLYEKCGFVETGKRLRAMKYNDGTYADETIMSKLLK
ncbi:MAG: GNAT family N-acetyltransferase [Lachnospiraceae bacterium]|nr:GNAT family N-acetyltransferase [Lachnospiraceae bacterium]